MTASNVLIPIVIVGASGLFFAFLIALAARIFRIDENPKIGQILNALPGINCGACGKAGCAAYAQSIIEEDAPINLCTPGGEKVASEVAVLTGKTAAARTKEIARVFCSGGVHALDEFDYVGIKTCTADNFALKGHKFCKFGCLGFGDCVTACKFDAIYMGPDGLPVIKADKCIACGACVTACPKKLIALHDIKHYVFNFCKSHDKGAIVRKICPKGCIGCGLCVKECPFGAITLVNNLAVIDYTKCKQCGKCVKVCPTGVLVNLRPKPQPKIQTK
ncbi:MAG: RnfABCDGE type electron transport complex subunit B [Candidatus Omnitrophica bacterium]|nr:RnfABCDGE type electron transport complex subunit B [Candidatus Omnitrophota bacterium]